MGSLPSTDLDLSLGAPFKLVTVWDGVEERFRRRLVPQKVGYVEETMHIQRRGGDPSSKYVVEFTHLFYVFDAHAKLS